jgi:hypothetical protein
VRSTGARRDLPPGLNKVELEPPGLNKVELELRDGRYLLAYSRATPGDDA